MALMRSRMDWSGSKAGGIGTTGAGAGGGVATGGANGSVGDGGGIPGWLAVGGFGCLLRGKKGWGGGVGKPLDVAPCARAVVLVAAERSHEAPHHAAQRLLGCQEHAAAGIPRANLK